MLMMTPWPKQSLIERLIAIENIYASATDLHHQVDVVEQAIKGSPDMTFDKDIQEFKDEEVRIRSTLSEIDSQIN